ncbi:MAG: hypothetical protein K2X81_23720, partial [Candidatus Obscuribacterales bacterium]|nr:hypothetical protein [Candidatus Obscuribacterales bacterium]
DLVSQVKLLSHHSSEPTENLGTKHAEIEIALPNKAKRNFSANSDITPAYIRFIESLLFL